MKMLTGFLESSEEDIRIHGDVVGGSVLQRQRDIGYLSESLPVYLEMSVMNLPPILLIKIRLFKRRQQNSTPEKREKRKEKREKRKEEGNTPGVISGVIKKSADFARLIIFSCSEMANDQVLQLLGMAGGTEYLNSVQLLTSGR